VDGVATATAEGFQLAKEVESVLSGESWLACDAPLTAICSPTRQAARRSLSERLSLSLSHAMAFQFGGHNAGESKGGLGPAWVIGRSTAPPLPLDVSPGQSWAQCPVCPHLKQPPWLPELAFGLGPPWVIDGAAWVIGWSPAPPPPLETAVDH